MSDDRDTLPPSGDGERSNKSLDPRALSSLALHLGVKVDALERTIHIMREEIAAMTVVVTTNAQMSAQRHYEDLILQSDMRALKTALLALTTRVDSQATTIGVLITAVTEVRDLLKELSREK